MSKKRKLRKIQLSHHVHQVRFWIIAAVVLAVACAALYWLFSPQWRLAKQDDSYLSQLTPRQVKDGVTPSFSEDDSTDMQDWSFYGETLLFYQSDYNPNLSDASLGLNAVLRNIETGEETSYFFSGGADNGIQTGELAPGVYEVYMNEQYRKKRVYFDDVVHSEPFYTIRRDGKVHEITLDADKDYLQDQGVELDRNYAFLTVTEKIPMVKTVDVMIDPGGNVYNENTLTTDPGSNWNGLGESELSMELAELVKQELENAGLRVALTRNAGDTPSYYGDSGRPAQGYDRQAKVFLSLSMAADDDTALPYFVVSPYVTGTLANTMAQKLRDAGIDLEYLHYGDLTDSAVKLDEFMQNEDWSYNEFSIHPQLRETGGKITATGKSETTAANSMFSDSDGMYGVLFTYGNALNDASMQYYQENKETIAKALADGILAYYQVGEMNETAAQ